MPTVKDVKVSRPSDKQIEQCKSWPTWGCDPSEFDWVYTQQETCLIVQGQVTVSDGENEVSFGPGDMVVFPVDLECTWRVKSAVKKHYKFD